MNSQEFTVFFNTYYYQLCTYAKSFVSEADAHEIVQELMAWYWVNHLQLELEGPVKNYLFKAVKNRALNLISRRSTLSRVTEILQKRHPFFDDPDFYIVDDLSSHINEALSSMPDEFREVFELNRFKNHTYSDIAKAKNVSVQTINYRMSQALKVLREALKEFLV